MREQAKADQTVPTCEVVDATDIQRELRPLVKPIDRLMRERGWSQNVLRLVGGRIQVVVDLEDGT